MTTTAGVSASAGAAATSGAKTMQTLTTDDFLKMLITELTNQDPFEPMKNQDLLNQISSIRKLEMDGKLNATLEGLMLQGNVASAGSLIGKLVAGLTPDRQSALGQVTGVRVSQGNVMLELDSGQQVRIQDVTRIQSPAAG